MKVLFVCNMGMHRSPTGARLWHDLYNDETDFVGIYTENKLKEKVQWADLIIVMEPHQRKFISERFPKEYLKKQILCLDIPDLYSKENPELIETLKIKLGEIKNA